MDKPAFPNPDPFGHGMTTRQYAAIKLKVPSSGNEELDDMIRESLRNDFAAKAMQGFSDSYPIAYTCERAYDIADGMLHSMEEK